MDRLLRVVNLVVLISSVRTVEYSELEYLGCMKPFMNSSVEFRMGASTWNGVIGIAACIMCNLNREIIMLRGNQCYCIQFNDLELLMTVNATYCNIKCEDDDQFTCGGNLGGSVYCNRQQNFSTSGNDIFDYRRDEFQMDCLFLSCGVPGEATDRNFRSEYLPLLRPDHCIIYCSLFKKEYAMVGWAGTENGPVHGKYSINSTFNSNRFQIDHLMRFQPFRPAFAPLKNHMIPIFLALARWVDM